MNRPNPVVLSWSSGKDSAWALNRLRQRDDLTVVALLTTFNEAADRVAMHAVRRELVARQAEAVGLPLVQAMLPWPCSNEDYERIMAGTLRDLRDRFDTATVAFGDLYLEDIRAYREDRMANWGGEALFPLWQLPTAGLAREMIAGGVRATITCVDPRQCPREFAGARFDDALLDALPPAVDPCGENGEFHTFVHDGPTFTSPVSAEPGPVVERDGFVYADLLPA